MNGPYVYCPYCATPLEALHRFGQVRPVCPKCGFVYFQDPKVAVIGLVIRAGRVLLIKRAVDPARGQWSLPGGYMDAGEMPEDALKRELQEEVGLEVQVVQLLDIYPMTEANGQQRGIVLAYRVEPLAPLSAQVRAGDDAEQAEWFGPGELPDELAFDSTRALLQQWL